MSERPNKRRRLGPHPFIDIEASIGQEDSDNDFDDDNGKGCHSHIDVPKYICFQMMSDSTTLKTLTRGRLTARWYRLCKMPSRPMTGTRFFNEQNTGGRVLTRPTQRRRKI
jgi:hypothetical protein